MKMNKAGNGKKMKGLPGKTMGKPKDAMKAAAGGKKGGGRRYKATMD